MISLLSGEKKPQRSWAGFGEEDGGTSTVNLPPSESDFFAKAAELYNIKKETEEEEEYDPFIVCIAKTKAPPQPTPPADPFAPLINESYDPFDIRPVEEVIAEAKRKAELERQKQETGEGVVEALRGDLKVSGLSTPTSMGGSPAVSSARLEEHDGFEDDFKHDAEAPLYDEDDTVPLTDFSTKFTGDGWELMLRYATKKQL